ncbi:hypothetical protein ACFWZ2_08755 [Streptomyces sp. NPDC059002]|uniref:hypothetical protein n=1 Tax=Streptomyces sp. NPDC059002 TaxID=3346690 RepID=UPI0036CA4214
MSGWIPATPGQSLRHVLRSTGRESWAAWGNKLVFCMATTLGLMKVVAWAQTRQGPWENGAFGLLLLTAAFGVCLPLYRRLSVRSLRRLILPLESSDRCTDGSFVLYLRNFQVDGRLADADHLSTQPLWNHVLGEALGYGNGLVHESPREVRVVREIQRLGAVIAVGDASEPLPYLPGANRYLLPHHKWKRVVDRDMRRARLVVMVAGLGRDSGPATSTMWEYAQARRVLAPERFVLLVCGDQDDYERFRKATTAYLDGVRRRSTPSELPDHPALRRPERLRKLHPLRGVITFGPDWTPRFTLFDPTASAARTELCRQREVVRKQLTPCLDAIEERLEGMAVHVPDIDMAFAVMRTAIIPVAVGCMLWSRFELTAQRAVIAVVCVLQLVGITRRMLSASETFARIRHPAPGDNDAGPERSAA